MDNRNTLEEMKRQAELAAAIKKEGIESFLKPTAFAAIPATPTTQDGDKEDAHEKEVMMQSFDRVRQMFEKRSWIMEGRGSYRYDDDRYKQEVRYLYDEFEAIRKDTWANISSKSFEYRQKIIKDFVASQPKEVKGGVVSEYQLCPKCFGNGWIPTTGCYQTSTTEQCDVCYGAKTLIKPVVFPPESQSPLPADSESPVQKEEAREAEEQRPKIVCLCGSTRFMEAFQEANLKFTCEGKIVLSVGCNTKSDRDLLFSGELTPELKIKLDDLHKRKIDLCDEVFVLNVGGYIGESTRSEIEYTMKIGKPIKYLESL